MGAFLLVILLVGVGYAAGYYHRDTISRRRHERARMMRHGEVVVDDQSTRIPGDLGSMIERWRDAYQSRSKQPSEKERP